jgi:hypothetical protein
MNAFESGVAALGKAGRLRPGAFEGMEAGEAAGAAEAGSTPDLLNQIITAINNLPSTLKDLVQSN